jgi:soluble lytic murein transglycosylase-like protein
VAGFKIHPLVVGLGFGLGALALGTRRASASGTAPKGPSKPAKPANTGGKVNVPSTAKAAAIAPLAAKYATAFNVPPSLLMALCGIESSYVPTVQNVGPVAMAKGRGGAWGLTQILLVTATDATNKFPKVAAKWWPKWDKTGPGLKDPNINLAMAAFLLSGLWKRFKDKPGNWYVTGLAWNQGAGGVTKFLAKGGGKLDTSVLTTGAKEYYARLQLQANENEAVNTLIAVEQKSGAFQYA